MVSSKPGITRRSLVASIPFLTGIALLSGCQGRNQDAATNVDGSDSSVAETAHPGLDDEEGGSMGYRWKVGYISTTYEVGVKRTGVMPSVIGEDNEWPLYETHDGNVVYSYDMGDWAGKSFRTNILEFASAQIDYVLRHGYPHESLYGDDLMDRFITQAAVWEVSCGLSEAFMVSQADPYGVRPFITQLANDARAFTDERSDALILVPEGGWDGIEKLVILQDGAWDDEHTDKNQKLKEEGALIVDLSSLFKPAQRSE